MNTSSSQIVALLGDSSFGSRIDRKEAPRWCGKGLNSSSSDAHVRRRGQSNRVGALRGQFPGSKGNGAAVTRTMQQRRRRVRSSAGNGAAAVSCWGSSSSGDRAAAGATTQRQQRRYPAVQRQRSVDNALQQPRTAVCDERRRWLRRAAAVIRVGAFRGQFPGLEFYVAWPRSVNSLSKID